MTFQPPAPIGGTTGAASAASTGPKIVVKPAQPDLITRYNLHDKLATEEEKAEAKRQDQKGKAWSSDRDERQASLQRRRDEMILQARRRMEAKIAAETKGES